ncbi:ATP-dependent RNA helicase TDRD9 [Caerostris darwini]|uniref:Probable ATP-dependent RNA helicase spindle-E n=1 Tax=Caerostris darwini TaxID=1538125 RepID=A0AAV4PSB8_9ARAC|nr:ATP-dependent RNA helicase TDRD9 [Caerostris darwini]
MHTFVLWRRAGTEYVEKIRKRDKELEDARKQMQGLSINSIGSLDTLDDVEDTTLPGDGNNGNDLENDLTQTIYDTYFKNSPKYDPNLAITHYRNEIISQLQINPVVIIQGHTGCGKTTQVPQYILDLHKTKGTPCNIVVTQPRKIAAISVARRVCYERKWELGSIVGYQVAMDSHTSIDTRITYMTTGVLLEKLVHSKRMDMYTHIIIDEVHERNQDIDFALLIIKKFLMTNCPRVKVILMSATFDTSEFAEYFRIFSHSQQPPTVNITGKTYHVTEHYLHELKTLLKKVPEFDLKNPCIDPCLFEAVLKLMCIFDRIEKHEQKVPNDQNYAYNRGAVLIFLPGYEEIRALSNTLATASFNKNFWIIPLHSTITIEEQSKVFRDAPSDQRKVIISTNIAESSVTVPDVRYVIDFCLTKNIVTDPATGYTSLQLEWASKANCIQRKGRTGRVDIGKVYRMVPMQFYNALPDYGIPEIKRCPLAKTILHVKKLNICKPEEMLAYALDPPDLGDIATAVLHLKEALALTSNDDPCDGNLTFIGRIITNLPLDIKLSKLIIFGYAFHCLEECIIIAASLSLQSFFARPFQKLLDAYRSRLSWADSTFSDCICFLNAYQTWKTLSIQGQFKRPGGLRENEWATLHFIQMKRIKEVDLLVKDIKKRLEYFHIVLGSKPRYEDNEESNILILKMVIAAAFFPYYYIQESLDESKINRDINENNPLSTVLVSGLPSKHGILYASALKEMFSGCSENIAIEFEESRAYIKFMNNYDKNASLIHPAVYMAIKMRKLQMPLNLVVFAPDEAERKTQQLLSSKSGLTSNTLASNRITVSGTALKKITLPALDIVFTDIFITQVNNCGHFWARYVTPETSNLVMFLDTTINRAKGADLKHLTQPPKINMLYLAPYLVGSTDKLYYRAQVQEIKNNKATVFYIDYGNIAEINFSDLRDIPDSTPDVLNTPALAFECFLSEVRPSSHKNINGQWSDEANKWFKSEISGRHLHAKIYSVVQGALRVELLKYANDGRVLNINKELIKLEYAEPAEENIASKQNHEMRINSYNTPNSYSESASKDLELSWLDTQDYTTIQRTGRSIRLHGPYNPLEVSFSGLSHIDCCKSVKIERDSVNSVSFDGDPQNSFSRILVAANLGIGQFNSELILRSTTLMPKIRGLPSLICLLFAPYVEFRTNKERTSYTGALCGLGCNPETGESVYPDHDIELSFDTEITLDDIQEVNAVRMSFNLLYHSDTDKLQYSFNPISIVQEETRKYVFNLLHKKRVPKEPQFYQHSGQWNQVPSHYLLDPLIEENSDVVGVLSLHKPIILLAETDNIDQNLYDLYKATESVTSEYHEYECKLCFVTVDSSRKLLFHLNSEKHQVKENQLRLQRR